MLNPFTYNPPATAGLGSSKPYGILEKLKEKKAIAEADLNRINKAIEAFEKNPELSDLIEAINIGMY